MANKIKGITVEIGGDTQPLERALKSVNDTSKSLQAELKEVNQQLKFEPKNTVLLKQKQELLTKEIANTGIKLNTLKEAEKQAQDQFKKGKVNEEQYRALQREVIKTESQLRSLESQANQSGDEIKKAGNKAKAAGEDAEKGSKGWNKLHDGIKSAAKGIAIGAAAIATAAAAAGIALLKRGAEDAIKAEKYVTQLDAVLKSTKGAVGMTKDELLALAEGFEKTTKFSAEMALESQNMLLTFTNIGKDVFPRATAATADMATAFGTEMSASAIQLGKALNDPTKGITALTRVGVTFTDQQKAQIKAMQEAGDMAGAQSVILAELEKEFGGSAKAAGQTLGGQLEILKNSFGAVAESVVNGAMPAIMKFLPQIQGLIDALSGGIKTGDFTKFAEVAGKTVINLVNGIVKALPKVISVGMTIVKALLNALLTNLPLIIKAAAELLIAIVKGIVESLPMLIPAIIDTVLYLVDVLIANLDLLVNAALQIIIALAMGLVNAIPALVEKIPAIIEAVVTTLLNNLPLLVDAAWQLIKGLAIGLVSAIPLLWDAMPKVFGSILDGVGNYFVKMKDIGKNLIMGLWNGIKDMDAWIQEKISEFGDVIVNKFKKMFGINSPSTLFKDLIGKNLALGLGEGFIENIKKISGTMINSVPINFAVSQSGREKSGNTITQINHISGFKERDSKNIRDNLNLILGEAY